jgi:hypothetical protein
MGSPWWRGSCRSERIAGNQDRRRLTEAKPEVMARREGSGGGAGGSCYTDGRAVGIGGEWKKKVQRDRGRAETEVGPGAEPAIDRADLLGRQIMRIFPR